MFAIRENCARTSVYSGYTSVDRRVHTGGARYVLAAAISDMQRREAEAREAPQDASSEETSSAYEGALWQPEYASYMIEALPGAALDLHPENWLRIEPSLRNRRGKLLVGHME